MPDEGLRKLPFRQIAHIPPAVAGALASLGARVRRRMRRRQWWRRSRPAPERINHTYALRMTEGWWLTLPVIVGGEMRDLELLVEPDEVGTLVQAWRRNGILSQPVDYKLRFGWGQTTRQRHTAAEALA